MSVLELKEHNIDMR